MAALTFPSGTPPQAIGFEPFTPAAGSGKHPAVVIAYGTRGMNPPFGGDIRAFARALAAAGYVALIPDYFARTGTTASADERGDLVVIGSFAENQATWVEALGDCLTFAAGRHDVDGGRLGLIGFSMGGNLALRAAMRGAGAGVQAVVDFYGPVNLPGFGTLPSGLASLPPVQIHHGTTDSIVPPSQSVELVRLLTAAGKVAGVDFWHLTYPGQDHVFTGQAVADSTKDTIDFLAQHL